MEASSSMLVDFYENSGTVKTGKELAHMAVRHDFFLSRNWRIFVPNIWRISPRTYYTDLLPFTGTLISEPHMTNIYLKPQWMILHSTIHTFLYTIVFSSVPDPLDPHVFGPPGSIGKRRGSADLENKSKCHGSRTLVFSEFHYVKKDLIVNKLNNYYQIDENFYCVTIK